MTEKWGYINTEGEWAIPPTFDHCMPHEEGVAAAKQNGLYGYIDLHGNWLITPRYNEFDFHRQGLIPIRENGKTHYINKFGETQFRTPYPIGFHFTPDGLAHVSDETHNTLGFINRQGRMVIDASSYCLTEDFREGFALVRYPDLKSCWFLNTEGKRVLGPFRDPFNDYSNWAGAFSDGWAWVREKKRTLFIDQQGKTMLELPKTIYPWSQYIGFREGLCTTNLEVRPGEYQPETRTGFIDRSGAWVIEPGYDSASHFTNGHAEVEQNKKKGVINKLGDVVIPLIYDDVGFFENDRILVTKEKQSGYMNSEGKLVIPMKYQMAHHFSEGLAAVAED